MKELTPFDLGYLYNGFRAELKIDLENYIEKVREYFRYYSNINQCSLFCKGVLKIIESSSEITNNVNSAGGSNQCYAACFIRHDRISYFELESNHKQKLNLAWFIISRK